MTGAHFRTATLAEVAQMLDWAAEEGWNPGLDDAGAFPAADPEGFFVAEIDGSPVAAISVVNHSDSFAFLGLYLCQPAFRGRGIGLALWRHALAHAGDRSIGLDGVPAQQANYARSGFDLVSRTQRLSGRFAPEALTLPLAGPGDLAALDRLDRVANGVTRPRFLRAWLTNGPTRKTVILREGATITGFATARACQQGCKIGPIIAPGPSEASLLARQAAAALEQAEVTIDIPETGKSFAQMLQGAGFEQGFETARMVRGRVPKAGPQLQAVATLELG
ncbi:GNAT family N-acetyltransferase [Pseudoponticoccus marisrubri]|uniref:Acetyltransferase n=1 Tax=Pseudoponticoccus marisrubri TaxID=1685382 RepID=A0A0W7WJM9_9RHOB|nr:GNAT family N-acetyltransferase [Pseudoponticoccus marisrubri]KUF10750.1 acetyltransferase [Pseudoponticoccus marisrubri]